MAQGTTILAEMTAAARGVVALIIGDRQAPSYFDFSQRGLIGSFIAFLAITGGSALLPMLLGYPHSGGTVFRSVTAVVLLFALQIGCAALVLRQLHRLDGLVPYLVADNWASFYVTIGTSIVALFGFSGDMTFIFVGILVIVIEVNIARVIVTLSPLQIAMFIVGQLVGVSIGLILIGVMFPPTPEELEAIAGAASSLPS